MTVFFCTFTTTALTSIVLFSWEKQFWLLSYSRLQGQFIRCNCSCLPGMHVCIGASRQTAKAIRWRPPPELKNTMIWPQLTPFDTWNICPKNRRFNSLTLLVLLPNFKFPQPTNSVFPKCQGWWQVSVLGLRKNGGLWSHVVFPGLDDNSSKWALQKVAASTSSRVPRPLLSELWKISQTSCLPMIIVDVCSHTDVLHGWYWMRTGTVYDLNLYTCVSTCVNFDLYKINVSGDCLRIQLHVLKPSVAGWMPENSIHEVDRLEVLAKRLPRWKWKGWEYDRMTSVILRQIY